MLTFISFMRIILFLLCLPGFIVLMIGIFIILPQLVLLEILKEDEHQEGGVK